MVLKLASLLLVGTASALDDGLALTPPMGWRSWNCFQGDVNDGNIRSTVDAMGVKREVKLSNGTVALLSLLDLGYDRVGVDDGWQECGAGSELPTSFHDAAGVPIVNLTKFPDLKALAAYAAKKGTKLGWYVNNCICHESASHIHNQTWKDICVPGDVQQLVQNDFEGLKVDSCGPHNDPDKYADLIKASGRHILIERAAQGSDTPTNTSWCPYHIFRSSHDIRASWSSVMRNLATVVKYQDLDEPISRPGCWAYPDMMMVGNLQGDLAASESRTHFGAWAIVSSPLILGLDVTNEATLTAVWPFITNMEAIAVNQQWAGHPGWRLNLTEAAGGQMTVWTKPQPGGARAFLAINMGSKESATFSLDLAHEANFKCGASGKCAMRDIWAGEDLASIGDAWRIPSLGSHDSMFVLLTPSSSTSQVSV